MRGIGSNNRFASASATLNVADMLDAADRLPLLIRRELHQANLNWDAISLAEAFRLLCGLGMPASRAMRQLAVHLRDLDQEEIERFSEQHQAQYGAATPHVLAGATPQPYHGDGKPALRRQRAAA